MRNVTILLAVVAMLTVTAWADTWDGDQGDKDYHNDLNWADGSEPTGSDKASFSTGGEAIITSDTSCSSLELNKASNNVKVKLESGTYSVGSGTTTYLGYKLSQSGSAALFTQTGGAFNITYHMSLGHAGTNLAGMGHGKYVISGGTFAGASNRSLKVGENYSSNGVGKGIFRVEGGWHADTASVKAITVGDLRMGNDLSRLEFDMKNDASPIQSINALDDVTLDGTIAVTGAAPDGTYTLLAWADSATNNTFTVDLADTTNWSWNSTTWQADKAIKVTVVPEPATMVLLAVGGIGALIRRRSRA